MGDIKELGYNVMTADVTWLSHDVPFQTGACFMLSWWHWGLHCSCCSSSGCVAAAASEGTYTIASFPDKQSENEASVYTYQDTPV